MTSTEMKTREILKQADIRIGGSRPQDILVNDKRFYSRVMRYRELGLGDNYEGS